MTARTQGGTRSCRDGVLSIEGADEAVIYISIATNFTNYKDITGNQVERAKNYLRRAVSKDYMTSRKAHVDFFQAIYGPCLFGFRHRQICRGNH